MSRFFISYRRRTNGWTIDYIYSRLTEHFGQTIIFLDKDKIPEGTLYEPYITSEIVNCMAILAIIDDSWLNEISRLDTPRDFVRIELEQAMNGAIPIVPLLIDKARLPNREKLPKSLQSLVDRQCSNVRASDFDNDMARLIARLKCIAELHQTAAEALARFRQAWNEGDWVRAHDILASFLSLSGIKDTPHYPVLVRNLDAAQKLCEAAKAFRLGYFKSARDKLRSIPISNGPPNLRAAGAIAEIGVRAADAIVLGKFNELAHLEQALKNLAEVSRHLPASTSDEPGMLPGEREVSNLLKDAMSLLNRVSCSLVEDPHDVHSQQSSIQSVHEKKLPHPLHSEGTSAQYPSRSLGTALRLTKDEIVRKKNILHSLHSEDTAGSKRGYGRDSLFGVYADERSVALGPIEDKEQELQLAESINKQIQSILLEEESNTHHGELGASYGYAGSVSLFDLIQVFGIRRVVSSLSTSALHLLRATLDSHDTAQRVDRPSAPALDRVRFTVASPLSVSSDHSFLMDVWIHLDAQRGAVLRRIQETDGRRVRAKTKSPVEVAHGTLLSVQLKVESMVVEDPEDTILWGGEPANASFRVTVPSDAPDGWRSGTVTVFVEGLRIAKLEFDLHIGEASWGVQWIPTRREERYRRAFASYASADREQVKDRIKGVRKAAPDLEILDKDSLQSGENREATNFTNITQSEVFYLFWSKHAKGSGWVDKEWRYALETRGPGFIVPVPLVSPEEVPPPPELASQHFDDWKLAFARPRGKSA
jgi:hypothetical protein